MTQAQDPNDRSDEFERQLRSLNRRVERLEDTQITGRELNRGFERVYEEIDHLQSEFTEFRDEVNQKFDEVNQKFDEVNQKLDTILRHITGIN